MTFFPDPKEKRLESEEYLDFIRTLPCVIIGCRREATPHHLRTVGAGASDYEAIPICVFHHRECQGRNRSFEETRGINLWREATWFLVRFIREKGWK